MEGEAEVSAVNKANLALTKLAIGLLSAGAVAGIAGRLAAINPKESGTSLAAGEPAAARLRVEGDRLMGEDWDDDGWERWGERRYRLAPPAGGWYDRGAQPWRTRTHYS